MSIEVGSFEAKTKLPELLRGVQNGNSYTITLRGKAIADLLPAQSNKFSGAAGAVDEMRSFMRACQATDRDGIGDLKALIEDGRA